MNQFILHIGRHKTGTSSLQKFLRQNRSTLAQHGYYYPNTDSSKDAHHAIARNFNRKVLRLGNKVELKLLRDSLDSLFKEISDRSETILLSSEAFQNCDPVLVAKRFDPKCTKVIVYIREQVDYVISSYQQAVHETSLSASLEESVSKYPDYDNFINRWVSAFGRDNIVVRVYDRRYLCRADIIHDFMSFLGVPTADNFVFLTEDKNPSIGGALLELKRLVNAVSHSSVEVNRKMFYNLFSDISTTNAEYRTRSHLSAPSIDSIRTAVSGSNKRVFDRYFGGVDVFARPEPQQPKEVAEVSVEDLARVLLEIRRRNSRVFEHIVDLLTSARSAESTCSTFHPAVCSPSADLSADLMPLLERALSAMQSVPNNFRLNLFASHR